MDRYNRIKAIASEHMMAAADSQQRKPFALDKPQQLPTADARQPTHESLRSNLSQALVRPVGSTTSHGQGPAHQ